MVLRRLAAHPRLFRRHINRRGAERRVTERTLYDLERDAGRQHLRADRVPERMGRRTGEFAALWLSQIGHRLEQLHDSPLRKSMRAAHGVASSRRARGRFAGDGGFAEFLARPRRRRNHQRRHQRQSGRSGRGRRVEILAAVTPVRAQRVDALVADRHVTLLVALADHLEQPAGRRVVLRRHPDERCTRHGGRLGDPQAAIPHQQQ